MGLFSSVKLNVNGFARHLYPTMGVDRCFACKTCNSVYHR